MIETRKDMALSAISMNSALADKEFVLITGVCSYVEKHVIDALEGYSQFLANEVSKV